MFLKCDSTNNKITVIIQNSKKKITIITIRQMILCSLLFHLRVYDGSKAYNGFNIT